MKVPKRPDPPKVNEPILLELQGERFLERPELSAAIVATLCAWNEIEDALGRILAIASGTEDAIACAMLKPVHSIHTKRDVVKQAIAVRFDDAWAEKFETVCERLGAASGIRNLIAHGHWFVHDAYPDALIRTAGLTDPLLQMRAWRQKELQEAWTYLFFQRIVLEQFEQELLASPEPNGTAAKRGRAWRLERSKGRTTASRDARHPNRNPGSDRTERPAGRPPGSGDPGSQDREED